MNAHVLQRVIERFVYEGLLVHNQYQGRRWRVTLQDLLEASASEPRITELLPGIILHRPTLIYRLRQDLPRHPDLQKLLQSMTAMPTDHRWHDIPVHDMQRAADRIAALQRHRRRGQRWRNMNIRVSEYDLLRLQRLASRTGQTKSEVLRNLIAKAAQE
ncbi:MAG: hypothetical protein HY543_00185 [Deltaproteobacteria bacterium]|nr:hypothetical protein [Deltaproteobacteria bacterium]